MFSIGEFSLATGIPVRTLRFYHDERLLVPAMVDPETNYRTYDERNLETAAAIVSLRALEFSLADIREILTECQDDDDILDHLERQKALLAAKLGHYRDALERAELFLTQQRQMRKDTHMKATIPEITERDVPAILIAGVRMQGKYSDCGQGFAKIGKRLGRYIRGKAMCLYYDGEYREDDANFEPCLPLRKAVEAEGISVRELPAEHCVTLLHYGPYEELHNSYARLLQYVKNNGLEISVPTREVYLKGPGMIFRGNPKKYVTEIQLPVKLSADHHRTVH